MRCQAKALARRKLIHRSIEVGGNRIGRMGRDANAQGFCFLFSIAFDLLNEACESFSGLAVRRPEDLLIGDALQTGFTHCFPRRAEIHDLTDARHTGANHFDAAEPGRAQHVRTREFLKDCSCQPGNPG